MVLKYFIFIVLVFFSVSVLAAQPVKGTVPVLVPLQPPPVGVDFDRANPLNSPPQQNDEKPAESVSISSEDAKVQKKNIEQVRQSTDWSGFKNFFFLLLTLVLAGAGVYYWRRGVK